MRPPSHLFAALLLVSPPAVLAQASPPTASLAKTLRDNAAPAHRVTAANLLGESEDPEALAPLCAGLGDERPEVRVAVAGALAKLGEPEAVGCLEARAEEPDAAVKAAQASALATLRGLVARPHTVYVKLGELRDDKGALSPELRKAVEARMRRRLFQVGALVAPAKETDAEARAVLKKQKLKALGLLPKVEAPAPGQLKLLVVITKYPGNQAIQGQATVEASEGEAWEQVAAMSGPIVDEALGSAKTK